MKLLSYDEHIALQMSHTICDAGDSNGDDGDDHSNGVVNGDGSGSDSGNFKDVDAINFFAVHANGNWLIAMVVMMMMSKRSM